MEKNSNVFAVPIFVLLPFYLKNFLRVAATCYGFSIAAFGAGCLVGFILAGVMRCQGAARFRTIATAVFLTSMTIGGWDSCGPQT